MYTYNNITHSHWSVGGGRRRETRARCSDVLARLTDGAVAARSVNRLSGMLHSAMCVCVCVERHAAAAAHRNSCASGPAVPIGRAERREREGRETWTETIWFGRCGLQRVREFYMLREDMLLRMCGVLYICMCVCVCVIMMMTECKGEVVGGELIEFSFLVGSR